MARWLWTPAEIHSCPAFGGDVGWFYGLVRDGWRIRLVEVLPGMGYCTPWPFGWRDALLAAKDVWHTKARKAKYVGKATFATNQQHFNVSLDNCIPLSEFLNDSEESR